MGISCYHFANMCSAKFWATGIVVKEYELKKEKSFKQPSSASSTFHLTQKSRFFPTVFLSEDKKHAN